MKPDDKAAINKAAEEENKEPNIFLGAH